MADDIFNLDDDGGAAPQMYDNISALRRSLPWLDELNPEQRQAIETTEGPLLVLSGAGTGKTKVLTTRLAYILSTLPVQPWNCLVVTFTNRAANEMKERVQNLIGDMANSVWLGTFHRICVKILRKMRAWMKKNIRRKVLWKAFRALKTKASPSIRPHKTFAPPFY